MVNWEPGSVFAGRYEIIRSLGAGGMGEVYLACDVRYRDFLVALKVLYPGVIRTREAQQRFRNEILASYRVNHPNIVRAFEYFDEKEIQAYAMEYVDGGDLSICMAAGAMEPEVVLGILKQVAAGLQAVHSQGIVHRDLKPENILLTQSGVVKISDFGVARLIGAQGVTQAGAMVGTPKYVAPEYVETGECDHRGDLYAVGVIAYEMLSGVSPFKSKSGVTLMLERFNIRASQLARLVPGCPGALSKVVSKAMRLEVERRYQSAQELAVDLEKVERGEEVVIDSVLARIGGQSWFLGGKKQRGLRPRTVAAGAGRRRLAAALWLAVLVLATVSALWLGLNWRALTAASLTFGDLEEGLYEGVVSGLFADDSSHLLRVWRTADGAYVLLGRRGCRAAKVDNKGRFECGDLKFEAAVKTLEGRSALGTMRELGWGASAAWNLIKSEGGS